MDRKILLTVLLAFFTLAFIPLAYSETIVFGPEVYTRGTGKPQKIVKSFSAIRGQKQVPVTLSIKNGEGKRGKVTSAVIEINGKQVLGPEEFDKQVDEIKLPIKLDEQNEIAVEVRGKPGTYITVAVLREPLFEILAAAFGDYVNLNQPTTVTFSALLEKSYPNLISVNLTQYDEKYKHVADLGILYDDGTHGDREAGDNSFRTQIVINELYPKMLNYRVSVVYKDNQTIKKVLSDFFSVNVAHIPSVTGVISPQGGTITLEGYAPVIFPAGAFPSNTTVKVMATSSPGTAEDYEHSVSIFEGGPRLPYEIRINSGYIEPATSFDIVLNVPDSFINTLPPNVDIQVFVQIFQASEHEAHDSFELFESTFDPLTKTVRAALPKSSFTIVRHVDGTYEAIVIVGTTLR